MLLVLFLFVYRRGARRRAAAVLLLLLLAVHAHGTAAQPSVPGQASPRITAKPQPTARVARQTPVAAATAADASVPSSIRAAAAGSYDVNGLQCPPDVVPVKSVAQLQNLANKTYVVEPGEYVFDTTMSGITGMFLRGEGEVGLQLSEGFAAGRVTSSHPQRPRGPYKGRC